MSISWIKEIWNWLWLQREAIGLISALIGLCFIIVFIKKLFILFRKFFLWICSLWNRLRNKPLINKLQTQNEELLVENASLQDIIEKKYKKSNGPDILGNILNVSKKDNYATYDFEPMQYEGMNWNVSIKYDPSKTAENAIIATEIKDPRCPKCGREFIHTALHWGPARSEYECPNLNCKNKIFSEHYSTSLRERVKKDAEGAFRDMYPKISKA